MDFCKIKKAVGKRWKLLLFRLYNIIPIKSEFNVLFIPHENCIKDKYDIINYHSDNVLCLLNYMIRQEFFKKHTFYLIVDDNSRLSEYDSYCKNNSVGAKVKFINRGSIFSYLRNFSLCKYIFVDRLYVDFRYKTSKQIISCLGYFTPFKNDYIYGDKLFHRLARINNKSYNFYFSTSDLSSRILSSDTGVCYSKFIPLGMPRNEIFFKQNKSRQETMVLKKYSDFSKIIVFTPTYRDYETDETCINRNFLGYKDADLGLLYKILENFNALLVLKLHPWQNKSVIEKIDSKNIVIYDTEQYDYSLYDLLSVSDALITDYTSTYFDYLCRNKPVIFNFYDIEKYKATRGFAFDGLEAFCAGAIVNQYNDLLVSLENILAGGDASIRDRGKINLLYNKYQDNGSSARICKFLFSV